MPASSSVRTWRTAFLSLRDETLTSTPRHSTIGKLLDRLLFSNSNSLLSAAPDLPPHEVTSDVLFLLELAANATPHLGHDTIPTLSQVVQLIHGICHRTTVELNPSSWTFILDSFGKMLEFCIGNNSATSSVIECLETVRRLMSVYHQKCAMPDNVQLVKFLLHIISCSHVQLMSESYVSGIRGGSAAMGRRLSLYNSLWEVQTVALTMLGEACSRVGSTFPVDIWHSTIEVLRKLMDFLASKSFLVEDNLMSRFYDSLLHCLHLILMDPKGFLSENVSGFVAALRMFFNYGLTKRPQLTRPAVNYKEKEVGSTSKLNAEEHSKTDSTRYKPPHLRKKQIMPKAEDSQGFSSIVDFASSDSDFSDSDGSSKDAESVRNSKVRVAAIMCIEDLCRADPKSFTSQWTMLLPTNYVLEPRKFEATLMTGLLFDPYLKARMASASALVVMLDGPATVFHQVAEYKESTKFGSFMALSSSLGQILMQLHTGIMYLIQRETHGRLLASVFKILMILISSTPYSRMPGELLPTVITSLQAKIEEGFPFKNDQTGLLAGAFSCLTAAVAATPSSIHVKEMLLREISAGFQDSEKKPGVLFTLFRHSEQLGSPTICFEALQALRAVSHNYPNIMFACWEQVSTIVSRVLGVASLGISTRVWKGHVGNYDGFVGEKVITAAVKVLDECLRGISGFKGTEELLDDKLLDTPFISDCVRLKKVSSAPTYVPESVEDIEEPKTCQSASEQWSYAIEKFIPLVLRHTSAMVRTASVTCFAGITSSVFISLTQEKQNFVISSLINAAIGNEVPAVRSAACRAIGVISCFPQICKSAEILDKFIHAIEINTRDTLVSVRITASWALANICDSVRHCIHDFSLKESTGSNADASLVAFLTECALNLTKDGDKIKSNAVRALGNLSRFVIYTHPSGERDKPVEDTVLSLTTNENKVFMVTDNLEDTYNKTSDVYQAAYLGDSSWLDRMVQAFISCVTTGNVKVQWNVCHALSNLFLNETIRLQDMDWAPSVFGILMLLLRDSANFKIRIQAAVALAVPASVLGNLKFFACPWPCFKQ
ncbi:HEAT repeat-containing protein 6 isoform X2 [Tripterygium wilfordii]|uniref:HEAT repeat-containing protein 6 isoform X2 n=1 Tax=Tripterygium wilfordii TaxID=458696 RepID=UPI0018F7F891|nr:HEAT repeat-containing protein 6 isoform X2 [Tripterygium wilfordii]